ncbi:NYN domain-containing protein [Egicoccus sp. AB-alg6-2]|uniref:NYN domain-containing protein n=1 Tax=Egicoccus sp. AB-alg6-2 TaxID=3242692 RepID=UPI00359EB91E
MPSTSPAPDQVPPPPPAAALLALPADAWGDLLPTIRAALNDVDDALATPAIRRLRAAPTGRLAGGRVRKEVCSLLGAGGPAWEALYRRLIADDVARSWAETIRAEPLTAPPTVDPAASAAPAPTAPTERELARTRERLRDARQERDALRRRLDGAESRAKQAEEAAASAEARVQTTQAENVELRQRVEELEYDRERAVARERRRGEAAQARLREELAELRRADEERRIEQRRHLERRRALEAEAAETQRKRRERRSSRTPRVVPGRPSSLPEGVARGSTEAARLLLHTGRVVLVDGYNLTRQHRDHLDLETQRAWLVQLLATAAMQRRIRPVVVFDGQRASVARPIIASREVEVRFTPEGITADDELVLAVEATDEPVLVVTDDRELQARVRVSGADVVGTAAFLDALG